MNARNFFTKALFTTYEKLTNPELLKDPDPQTLDRLADTSIGLALRLTSRWESELKRRQDEDDFVTEDPAPDWRRIHSLTDLEARVGDGGAYDNSKRKGLWARLAHLGSLREVWRRRWNNCRGSPHPCGLVRLSRCGQPECLVSVQ
jgi:hypothetical protein